MEHNIPTKLKFEFLYIKVEIIDNLKIVKTGTRN